MKSIFWLFLVLFTAQFTLHGCASNQPKTPQVKQNTTQQSETKTSKKSSSESKSADSSQQKTEKSPTDTEKSQQSTANKALADTEKPQQSTAKKAPADTEKSQQSTAKTAPSSSTRASEVPNIPRGTIEETATRQRDKASSGQKTSHAKDAPEQTSDQQSSSRTGQSGAPQAPAGSRSPPQTALTKPRYAPTSEELKSRLDRRLDNSLSTFDGKLLKERAIIESSRTTRSAGEGEAGIAGESDAEMAGSTASTATPEQVNTSGSGHEPESTSTQASQTRQTARRSGQIPVDIPDGHDDDIVARQLREAAEKETDPALKKKLWEEYKTYKKSSGI